MPADRAVQIIDTVQNNGAPRLPFSDPLSKSEPSRKMRQSVEIDALTSPAMMNRYARRDRAELAGIRATLEALGIALPEPLKRKAPGRPRMTDPPAFLAHSAT